MCRKWRCEQDWCQDDDTGDDDDGMEIETDITNYNNIQLAILDLYVSVCFHADKIGIDNVLSYIQCPF